MNLSHKITLTAKKVLQLEAEAIARLAEFIDEGFEECVKAILSIKGRVVVTGIGKSANIAQKIVATLNSTGTPALFMHAADAIHGDLGMIQPEDITAIDIMTPAPLTIEASAYAVEALALMQHKSITQLIVTNSGKFGGFVHLHDLLKEGLI